MLKEHQVHAAVFGHDHVLEHIEYQGVDYFVSGGGSLEENGLHHLPNITVSRQRALLLLGFHPLMPRPSCSPPLHWHVVALHSGMAK